MKEKKIRKAVKSTAKENHLKFKDVKNKLKEEVKPAPSEPDKPEAKPYLNPRPKQKLAEKPEKLSASEQFTLLHPNNLVQFEAYVQHYDLSQQTEALLLKPENFAFFHIYNKYHCLREKNQIKMIADNNPQVIHEFQKRWHYSLHVKMKGEALRNKETKPTR